MHKFKYTQPQFYVDPSIVDEGALVKTTPLHVDGHVIPTKAH